MEIHKTSPAYTSTQTWALVALRVFIGWHLLYEGVVKLWNTGWSAGGYLMDSQGLFAEFFYKLAANPQLLALVDFLNVWGLILIGLSLILGLFTRIALFGGMLLLGLYYLSHPALIGVKYSLPSEGSYLLVNKNLIEITSMLVLFLFPSSQIIGLDRLLARRRQTARSAAKDEPVITESLNV
jgi:thiosulfate dehydrogenase [quinone] large subunit